MQAINFPQANTTFGKPESWTDEQCYSVNAWCGNVPLDFKGNEAPAIDLCWKVTPLDIQNMQQTGVLWSRTFGRGLTPISITTDHPFNPPQLTYKELPEDIFTAIHEAIGAGSMCWEAVDKAGIFQSEKAADIALKLCNLISQRMQDRAFIPAETSLTQENY